MGPESRQPHPENPVAWTQPGTFHVLFVHSQLLAKCQVLDRQPGFANEHRSVEHHTRFENAHFRTREIRKWAILTARRTRGGKGRKALSVNAGGIIGRDRGETRGHDGLSPSAHCSSRFQWRYRDGDSWMTRNADRSGRAERARSLTRSRERLS